MKRKCFLSFSTMLSLGSLVLTVNGYAQPSRQSLQSQEMWQNVSEGHRGNQMSNHKKGKVHTKGFSNHHHGRYFTSVSFGR